jgi:hypothetical protein
VTILTASDQRLKFPDSEFQRGLPVEKEGGFLIIRQEMIHYTAETLGKQKPIKGFASNKIAITMPVMNFLSGIPQADCPKQGDIPVLSVPDRLCQRPDYLSIAATATAENHLRR